MLAILFYILALRSRYYIIYYCRAYMWTVYTEELFVCSRRERERERLPMNFRGIDFIMYFFSCASGGCLLIAKADYAVSFGLN